MNQGMFEGCRLPILKDISDPSLIEILGIDVPMDGVAPVETMADSNSNLPDLNDSQYATLPPPTPQPDLAINSGQTGYESNSKWPDFNASQYSTLLPPTPQPDMAINSGQTSYRTIFDTDEVPGFQGHTEVSDTLCADSNGSIAMDSCDETFVQNIATDSTSNSIAGDSNGPPVLNTSSSTEQKIILNQECVIIPKDTYRSLMNLLETHIPLSFVSLSSPSPSVNQIALEVAPGSGGSQYFANQPNTSTTVTPPGKSSQSKPRAFRRQRPKKPKKYEMTEKLHDPAEEKKRQKAIYAKMKRDQKDKKLKTLEESFEAVTKERDALLKQVEELKRR